MIPKNGKRQQYPSGALRSDATGRGRFDLVSPYALRRLAILYEHGGIQKGERNWELGFPISRACSSAIGHIYDYLKGDRSEDHLAAASWQMFCAMHFEEQIKLELLPKELTDTPVLPELPKAKPEGDPGAEVEMRLHCELRLDPPPKKYQNLADVSGF